MLDYNIRNEGEEPTAPSDPSDEPKKEEGEAGGETTS